MKIVKLPSLYRIKDYANFYKIILGKAKVLIPKSKLINQSAFSMNTANETVLKNHIKEILWKKNKYLGKWRYERAFAMHWMNYSPRIDDSVQSGYIKINKRGLFVRARLDSPKYG